MIAISIYFFRIKTLKSTSDTNESIRNELQVVNQLLEVMEDLPCLILRTFSEKVRKRKLDDEEKADNREDPNTLARVSEIIITYLFLYPFLLAGIWWQEVPNQNRC